jgi:hypothetical protein
VSASVRGAAVTVKIGRAVTGVYNKVMNFRSVDPRDNRAGMSRAKLGISGSAP